MENVIEIELFNGYTCENVEPCDWRKHYHKNYFAKVEMDSDGVEQRTYAPISDESDLYFNVSEFNVGDILVASVWYEYKQRQFKHYYYVLEKSDTHIKLLTRTDDVDFTTYRKTFRATNDFTAKATD